MNMFDNNHPETYTIDRDTWLLLNRALCGASLQFNNVGTDRTGDRKKNVNEALEALSRVYDEALNEV